MSITKGSGVKPPLSVHLELRYLGASCTMAIFKACIKVSISAKGIEQANEIRRVRLNPNRCINGMVAVIALF